MYDKASIIEDMKGMLQNGWTIQDLEDYAEFMEKKYSTLKHGDNVIHLEYYHQLIDNDDISTIEANISSVNLELSRFDKNGVAYASIEDFTLQVSLCLSDPIIQNLTLGVIGSALWDSIKTVTMLIWNRMFNRHWINAKEKKLNFGLRLKIGRQFIELKLDNANENIAIESLDKILDLIREVESIKSNNPRRNNLFIYDEEQKVWKEVDLLSEMNKRTNNKTDK